MIMAFIYKITCLNSLFGLLVWRNEVYPWILVKARQCHVGGLNLN